MKAKTNLSITDLNVNDKLLLKQWNDYHKEFYEYRILVKKIWGDRHIIGSFSFKNAQGKFEKYPSDFICVVGPKDIITKL